MKTNLLPAPVELKCEYLVDPIGIDAAKPRLSWIIPPTPERRGEIQSAYQILAARDEKRLAAGDGNLWDSGKVQSDTILQQYSTEKTASGATER